MKLASFEAIVRAFAQAQVRYLDEQPQLLFTLRKVDAKDLVARAGAGLPPAGEPLQLLFCGQLQGYQRKAGSE